MVLITSLPLERARWHKEQGQTLKETSDSSTKSALLHSLMITNCMAQSSGHTENTQKHSPEINRPSKTNLPKRSNGSIKLLSTFLRTNLHQEPRLVQDTKVTVNQGRKKIVQIVSHLQDDVRVMAYVQQTSPGKLATGNQRRVSNLSKGRSLDQLLQKRWGKKKYS